MAEGDQAVCEDRGGAVAGEAAGGDAPGDPRGDRQLLGEDGQVQAVAVPDQAVGDSDDPRARGDEGAMSGDGVDGCLPA